MVFKYLSCALAPGDLELKDVRYASIPHFDGVASLRTAGTTLFRHLVLVLLSLWLWSGVVIAEPVQLDVVTSFESVNFPNHFVRHRFSLGELTRINVDLDRQDASFIVRRSLTGQQGAVSFESVNYPGYFLRHQSFRILLHKNDRSDLFRRDASFVVRSGLADAWSASFESVNMPGHFLRHRDFHLWVERSDNSDVFRRDASFRPKRGFSASVSLDAATKFESANFPGYFIRHRFSLGRITRLYSDLDQKDSTFVPRTALNGAPYAVSLESSNYPGHFLRHQNFRLKLHRNDASDVFRQDASFVVRPGLSRLPGTVSFESANFPGYFLRHTNYELWIARDDGSELFRQDASFRQGGGAKQLSLESMNIPDHFIRHRFSQGELTPVAPDSNRYRQDATFVARPALSGASSGISFESVNYPGHFLRHQNYRLILSRDDGSDSSLFRQDASFVQRPGLATGSGMSFESVNMPGHFIRHRGFHLWVERNDGSDLFRWDASFREPRTLFQEPQLMQTAGHGLYVEPGRCTRFFRSWRRGGEEGNYSMMNICPWIMGIAQHCRARDAFVAIAYDANARRYLTCSPYSRPDDVLDQAEHIARGVYEGLVTAYVAAAPYLGPIVSGVACVNGVIYACATLALDVAGETVQLPPEATQALAIANEVTACIEGNFIDCAQLGARGARSAGVTIPGEEAVKVFQDAQQCRNGDFRACVRLGFAAADAAGVPVDVGASDVADIQSCLEGDDEACMSLANRAARAANFPLGGVTQGAENAQRCAAGDANACTQLGRSLAEAAR